jgi:hypothetical protein
MTAQTLMAQRGFTIVVRTQWWLFVTTSARHSQHYLATWHAMPAGRRQCPLDADRRSIDHGSELNWYQRRVPLSKARLVRPRHYDLSNRGRKLAGIARRHSAEE